MSKTKKTSKLKIEMLKEVLVIISIILIFTISDSLIHRVVYLEEKDVLQVDELQLKDMEIHRYKLVATDAQDALCMVLTELESATNELDIYKQKLEILNTLNGEDTPYTHAATIWKYLKIIGLNDYVAAGIMGNIMTEVGGHTLNLSRYSTIETANYFGICQWAGARKERLLSNFGTTIEDQCRFLGVELFEQIPKGSAFYSMTNEKEAALFFAKYFERCAPEYYTVRQEDATMALKYFTQV